MEYTERKKRNIAFEKTISELKKEDIRVKVIGTIIEKDGSNNSIVIDNGKAQLRVLLDADKFNDVDAGRLVRVIGVVIPPLEGETVELKGEIIQDFSKLNPEIYEKYLNLRNN